MAQYIDERGDVVSTAQTNRREELTPVEARQGLLGRPVLMVLIGGLILAFLAWGGVEMWGGSQDRDAAAPTTTTTSTTDNTVANQPRGSGTFDNNTPADEPQQTVPTDRDPTPESSTGGASQQVTPDGTQQ